MRCNFKADNAGIVGEQEVASRKPAQYQEIPGLLARGMSP